MAAMSADCGSMGPGVYELELDEAGRLVELCAGGGNVRMARGSTVGVAIAGGACVGRHAWGVHVVRGDGTEFIARGRTNAIGTWRASFDVGVTGAWCLEALWIPEGRAEPEGAPNFEKTPLDALLGESERGEKNLFVVDPWWPGGGVESLRMESLLARCVGPLSRWGEQLELLAAAGYNAVHLTPLQVLGQSGSAYSIARFLEYADGLFEGPLAPEEKERTVAAAVRALGARTGTLLTTDVVLNHCADNAPWLAAHPEGASDAFSTAPHLQGPLALDQLLQKFSSEVVGGRHAGLRADGLTTPEAVDRVLDALRAALDGFRLHEWFQVDTALCLHNFEAYKERVESGAVYRARGSTTADVDRTVERHEHAREGDAAAVLTRIGLRMAGRARYGIYFGGRTLYALCTDSEGVLAALAETGRRLRAAAQQTYDAVLDASRGHIRYQHLEARRGPLGLQHWEALLPRYFTPVKLSDAQQARRALRAESKIPGIVCEGTEPTALQIHDKSYVIGGDPREGDCDAYYAVEEMEWDAGDAHPARAETDTAWLANNGWIMDGDAQANFAAPGALAYFARSVVVWSDCVKLRYGAGPADSPAWALMRAYVTGLARAFGGLRLDNCHGTPLHVASRLLQDARRANPNLFIYAELFTGDAQVDWIFERSLGINALIREALNYRSNGDALWGLGSMAALPAERLPAGDARPRARARQPRRTPCPALLYDCTHDNETPAQLFTAAHALPLAALAAAAPAAVGSTRGFDEGLAHNPSVVTERRLYLPKAHYEGARFLRAGDGSPAKEARPREGPLVVRFAESEEDLHLWGSFNSWKTAIPVERDAEGLFARVPVPPGPVSFECKLQGPRGWAPLRGFETHVSDGNENSIVRAGLEAEARGAAGARGHLFDARRALNALSARVASYAHCRAFEAYGALVVQRRDGLRPVITFVMAPAWRGAGPLSGEIRLPGGVAEPLLHASICFDARFHTTIPEGLLTGEPFETRLSEGALLGGAALSYDGASLEAVLKLEGLSPGSVIVLQQEVGAPAACLERFTTAATPLVGALGSDALSRLLFSCDNEERDRSAGARGAYELEGLPMRYAGLFASWFALQTARRDGSQALLDNLRAGDWHWDYHKGRITEIDPQLGATLTALHEEVRTGTPQTYRFIYWAHALEALMTAAIEAIGSQLEPRLRALFNEDQLCERLALAAYQFHSHVPSSPLEHGTAKASLCAGLPHFATGFMRAWGRDTFIALRGVLLATGRRAEARQELLSYASTQRHGLLPNLLDSCLNSRYNARDATWWWANALKEYVEATGDAAVLEAPVVLRHHGVTLPLHAVLHAIYIRHINGISFREVGAGPRLDEHMTDNGFNVEVKWDPEGLLPGGNAQNCGTWMDKMGSSEKARNRGVPSTSRDGTPVEVLACFTATTSWLSTLSSWPYKVIPTCLDRDTVDNIEQRLAAKSVPTSPGITYSEISAAVIGNFEKNFFVPEEGVSGPEAKWVNRKGIVKDSVGSSHGWTDFQLRCNAGVALGVCPALLPPPRARPALRALLDALCAEPGRLGVKTLDPHDRAYRPDYDNGDDGTDPSTAHGANYHQGPEWVWPLGTTLEAYARAYAHSADATQRAARYLYNVRRHLEADSWGSLPELTHANGRFCRDSCPAQAWSVGTMLAFLASSAEHAPAPAAGPTDQWHVPVPVGPFSHKDNVLRSTSFDLARKTSNSSFMTIPTKYVGGGPEFDMAQVIRPPVPAQRPNAAHLDHATHLEHPDNTAKLGHTLHDTHLSSPATEPLHVTDTALIREVPDKTDYLKNVNEGLAAPEEPKRRASDDSLSGNVSGDNWAPCDMKMRFVQVETAPQTARDIHDESEGLIQRMHAESVSSSDTIPPNEGTPRTCSQSIGMRGSVCVWSETSPVAQAAPPANATPVSTDPRMRAPSAASFGNVDSQTAPAAVRTLSRNPSRVGSSSHGSAVEGRSKPTGNTPSNNPLRTNSDNNVPQEPLRTLSHASDGAPPFFSRPKLYSSMPLAARESFSRPPSGFFTHRSKASLGGTTQPSHFHDPTTPVQNSQS